MATVSYRLDADRGDERPQRAKLNRTMITGFGASLGAWRAVLHSVALGLLSKATTQQTEASGGRPNCDWDWCGGRCLGGAFTTFVELWGGKLLRLSRLWCSIHIHPGAHTRWTAAEALSPFLPPSFCALSRTVIHLSSSIISFSSSYYSTSMHPSQ